MQQIFDSETMGVPRPENFQSPKFLKKNSKLNTIVKTLNMQKKFDFETMSELPPGGGVRDPKVFRLGIHIN